MAPPEKGYLYRQELLPLLAAVIQAYRVDREQFWQEELEGKDWTHPIQMLRDADEIAADLIEAGTCVLGPSVEKTKRVLGQIEHEYRQVERQYWEYFCQHFGLVDHKWMIDSNTDLWDFGEIDEGLHEGTVLRAVWERVCIEHALEVVGERVPESTKRLLLLVQQVRNAEPTGATRLFLRHVSRCFIWGFDTECVILCRSSLDSAFRDNVPDSTCLERFDRPQSGFTLWHRIQAACPVLIDEDIRKAADVVRTRGTKAVHYEPEGCADVLGTIALTTRVIAMLTRKEQSRGAAGL